MGQNSNIAGLPWPWPWLAIGPGLGDGLKMEETTSTSQQHQPSAPTWKRRSGIQQKVQAAVLQRLLYDAAVAMRASCTKDGVLTVTRDEATALAQLVRAWDTAADRLRVLRGKGLPASVKSRAGRSTAQPQPVEQP